MFARSTVAGLFAAGALAACLAAGTAQAKTPDEKIAPMLLAVSAKIRDSA